MVIRLIYALGLLAFAALMVAAIVAGSMLASAFWPAWLYWLLVATIAAIVFWPRQQTSRAPPR